MTWRQINDLSGGTMDFDGYGGAEQVDDGGSAFDVEPGYHEGGYGDEGGYVEMGPGELDARIEQAVQERVAPFEQAAYDAQRNAEAERLVDMYPQLQQQEEA